MSIKITEECINCGACEDECPNHAIYEGGKKWRMSDGTTLKKKIKIKEFFINPTFYQKPKKKDIYFIVSEKCTECVGFYEEPQCMNICPVNSCILDDSIFESKKDLMKKKIFLHSNY